MDHYFAEISMPSSQYYLSMDDTSIATMDTASSNATAIALGNTEVHLKDKRILSFSFTVQ